ncbi:MAG: MMPL family transporter [Frankia sp.]|nr:MMPL family transporter [Frankia sp.]
MSRTSSQHSDRAWSPSGAGPAGPSDPAGARPVPNHLAARAARWSVRHRGLAIGGWLIAVIAVLLVGNLIGTKTLQDEDWLVGEDGRAQQTLLDHGFESQAEENVLIQRQDPPPGGMLADPEVRAVVNEVVAGVTATGEATSVLAPLAVPGAAEEPGLVSPDGRSVLVTFDIVGESETAADRIQPLLDAVAAVGAAHPGLAVEQFGDASIEKALDETMGDDFQRAELSAIPLTIAILLIVFGALVAALVPVVLALTAFVGALGVVAFTSRLEPTNEIATSVMLLIGLAVGVDYALFYIRREREERAAGAGKERALAIAADTSGHAVLVSGLTVAVSLAGLMLTGMSAFTGIAVGTIVVVLVALLGSITVLPALLSLLGDRIELGRMPWRRSATGRGRRGRRASDHQAPAAGAQLARVLGEANAADRARREQPGKPRLLDRLMRRPLLVAVVTGGLLVALAAPALTMRTAELGTADLPREIPVMETFEKFQTAFPGGPAPAVIVVSAPDVTAAPVTAAIDALTERALAEGIGFQPVFTDISEDRQVARVTLPLVGEGTDEASLDAVRMLRDDLIPATIETVPDTTADVSGWAASSLDFNSQLNERTPIVIAFVLLLAFALLLAAFRSATIAGVAVGLNLLSVGAAYGLLVLVFQHEWAEDLLGFTSAGAIANWMPLMLFVILFGLSMDYQVFLLSRVREARRAGMDMRSAALSGLRSSAGVVTSAAVIMVAVFSIFATLSQVSMKQLGIGLGAAIFIDATIIRVLLMPALLTLLGDRAWRVPATARPAAATVGEDGRVALPQPRDLPADPAGYHHTRQPTH